MKLVTVMRNILLMALAFISTLGTQARAVENFNKEDANQLFTTSFVEWKSNVWNAKRAGQADYETYGQLQYTMFFKAPDGSVRITPSYKNETSQKP